MKRPEREIVKEQRKDGMIVCRYSDFDGKINDDHISNNDLGWRFTLIIEKFKLYLDGLGLGHEENVPEGIVLSSIIKDAEKELNEIADIIDEAIGNVCIFYKEDKCYNNFYEREVAGLAFLPADKKAKEVSA